jgi:hypothetical protein
MKVEGVCRGASPLDLLIGNDFPGSTAYPSVPRYAPPPFRRALPNELLASHLKYLMMKTTLKV